MCDKRSYTVYVTRMAPSTPHRIHTFSAKEKDAETGYSYFGSRYYSSDLSIWLSVDPMSDKYPSLSPYTYCANNPIKLVDPNGATWEDPYDKEFSEKLINHANNRIKYYQEKLTKTKNSKKQAYYNTCIQILRTQVDRIEAMGKDKEITFHFQHLESIEGCVRAKNNNHNYIQIEYKDEAVAFHEIAHYNAYVQKSNPYWKFNEDYGFLGIDYENPDFKNNIILANKYWNKEELTAYKAQFLYNPKTMHFRSGKNNYVRNLNNVWDWMKDWSILKPVKGK